MFLIKSSGAFVTPLTWCHSHSGLSLAPWACQSYSHQGQFTLAGHLPETPFPDISRPSSFPSGLLSSNVTSVMRLALITATKINPQLFLIMFHHYYFHGTNHCLKSHLYFFRHQLSIFWSVLTGRILPNLLTMVSPCPGPSPMLRLCI